MSSYGRFEDVLARERQEEESLRSAYGVRVWPAAFVTQVMGVPACARAFGEFLFDEALSDSRSETHDWEKLLARIDELSVRELRLLRKQAALYLHPDRTRTGTAHEGAELAAINARIDERMSGR